MIVRSKSTQAGELVAFDDVWQRRQIVPYATGIDVNVPAIEDLIRTKEWAMRAKDVHDIQLLRLLRAKQGAP